MNRGSILVGIQTDRGLKEVTNELSLLWQAHYILWLTDPDKGFFGSAERKKKKKNKMFAG